MTTRSPPVTRKKTAALRVYEDYPASPSEPHNVPPTGTVTEIESTPATRLESAIQTELTTTVEEPRTRRAPSLCSHRSTASAVARIKQAELEAEEQLMELRRQELRMQADFIKKKLALEVATIQEDTDRESVRNDVDTEQRVHSWLQRSHQRGERSEPDVEQHAREPFVRPREKSEERAQTNRVTFDQTPARQKEGKIERLADALEKMARHRAPPRQTQELPIFSGDPREWLPFKAAMRDSTNLLNLSPAENLARLRSCLRGEARQAVAALLYAASGPHIIMQTLEQCYGRPEMIIDQALEEIRKLPRIGTTASELNAFAVKLQNAVTVITCIDERGYLMNPMLVRNITEKLSPHIKARWCDYAEENGSKSEAEIITLSKFLMREADRAMRHAYNNVQSLRPSTTTQSRPTESKATRKPVYATTEETKHERRSDDLKTENQCLCCGAKHKTTECGKLKQMTVPKRWEWAKETRVCFRCLNSKHRRLHCKGKRCGIEECRHPHHALLHLTDHGQSTTEKEDSVESVTTASAHTTEEQMQVLLKVCPITLRGNNGKDIRTYALLDEGSTITLIDEDIASKIGTQGPTRALNIVGATTSQQEPNSRVVKIRVRGQDERSHCITARTVKNLMLGKQSVNADLTKYPHLRELQPDVICYSNAKPRLLIGADNWHLIVTRKLLTGKRRQPAASLTRLGWILHGAMPSSVVFDEETVLHVRTPQQTNEQSYNNDDALSELVKAHYNVDALGVSIGIKNDPKEVRAIEIFEKTVKRANGRFEVGLPWNSDNVTMPPSYDMALRRLKNIEQKMDRSPEFKTAYMNQVRGLLEKGYAEEVTNDNINDSKLWYLPHFAVLNPNKPNKVRMVFDAAAKANGVCLNDVLLDGPDMLRPLLGVLFGFRTKRIAVTADIREMFLRVKIRPEDRVAQHFLWREGDKTIAPKKYVMTSMIFGARSSPFLAHSVRNKNASDFKDSHPLAYDAITQRHYMDDWIDSFDSEELAKRAMQEVIFVHKEAGFELASWSSNCEEIMTQIPDELRAHTPKEIGSNAHPYNKALGILWTPGTDELGFNTQMTRVPNEVKTLNRVPTKREALSAVMSLFDPLGLLSPYTITAKITLQELWRKKVDWDEYLPPEEAVAFTEWQTDLEEISHIRLPRCYDTRYDITERQLHVFCDASEQAFATVAYWRFKDNENRVNVAIVAGKAKVAPLKAQSIPRMELQAALIGARLATHIMQHHPWNNVKVTFWTDSKTVLHWIQNDARKYTPYVAHRLSEISELSQPEQWRWISTEHNVADDATRSGKRLNNDSRWFTGPAFLYDNEEDWPVDTHTEESPLETIVMHTKQEPALIEITRFSSYQRLVRALARALLFIDKCRRRANKLTVKHLQEAERLIMKEAQANSFPAEIQQLKRGKNVDRKSRLHQLDPIYGDDQIIRLNGRINAANVPDEHRNPPILDGSEYVTRLIIRQEHETNHHAGREHLVNNLRQRYWILRLRPTVRTILKQCVVCKARRATPTTPIKGNLPAARLLSHTRPFTNCGVDCYGPMFVTIGRRREKRWGMLFTCLVTRAIHIELIASLSTDSAIMALRRMAARRGIPQMIISDNATNFHGADVELKNAYREWLPALEEYALTKNMEWRYIDPGAPNQGGAWERMIKSVKTAMSITLQDRAPKEEVLHTLTTEIEHTVNSRPLTHVPVDPEDQEALTPNHFLLGTANGLPYIGNCNEADKRAWRAAQALANTFWTRWIKEYLPTLAPRGDAQRTLHNVKPGDVVVIADGLLPRNVWPKGVVEQVHTGPDGVVRSAEVRTKGGIFRRPVRRLVVLPIERGSEDLRRGETVTDDEKKSPP